MIITPRILLKNRLCFRNFVRVLVRKLTGEFNMVIIQVCKR